MSTDTLFPSQKYFDSAIKLINRQIELYSKSPDFSLNMEFFKKRLDYSVLLNEFDRKDFFEKKIQHQLFYWLEDEFYIHRYYIPKWITGVRKYAFLSYQTLVVYYAICLYICDLFEHIYSMETEVIAKILETQWCLYIHSSGNQIQKIGDFNKISYWAIRHNEHYKAIIKSIKKHTQVTSSKKHVLKIDIQNFFEDIEIPRLFEFIGENITLIQEKGFTQDRKEKINDFFKYLSNNWWLIQSDANLASNTLADLYLVQFDFALIDFLRKNKIQFKYHRYVDDIYLIFDDWTHISHESILYHILPQIEELFYIQLWLRINSYKTKIWTIENEDNWKDFVRELKNISQVDSSPEVDEDDVTPFHQKWLDFMDKVKKLNDEYPRIEWWQIITQTDGYSFNEIFIKDDTWKNLLEWLLTYEIESCLSFYPKNLSDAFSSFNFHNILLAPKAFLAVINRSTDIHKNFLDFFNKKTKWTFADSFILWRELIFNKNFYYSNRRKIERETHRVILDFYKPKKLITSEIKIKIYDEYHTDIHLCEQIKLRIIAESKKDFSIACNHLLNEFHRIIFMKSGFSKKIENFKQKEVVTEITKMVPYIEIEKIRLIIDFFDRRNKNNVSHSGWISINEQEYWKYKRLVMHIYEQLNLK